MSQLKRGFLACIQDSYRQYIAHGARSTEKLKPVHQWIADTLKSRLGDNYEIYSMRQDGTGGEIQASGLYYDKKVDIGVKFNGRVISGIGFKFVTSNYQQNSRNYFENMLGETANLRRSEVGYCALLVLPSKIKYLNRGGGTARYEIPKSHNLETYLKLWRDCDFPHKPEALGIVFVDIDYDNDNVTGFTDVDKMLFNDDIKAFLETEACLDNFFNIFVKMAKHKAALSCR